MIACEDDTPFNCGNCGRQFGVIWNNDGLDMPVESCPFCGDEMLTRRTLEQPPDP
jgi:predicted RNA-binding Zn-ribbon protein involved in translation (DUF1610 family)